MSGEKDANEQSSNALATVASSTFKAYASSSERPKLDDNVLHDIEDIL